MRADVRRVAFVSADEARVTYHLVADSTVVLRDASGVAVRQDGVWKVSVKSLCALAALGDGIRVPGC